MREKGPTAAGRIGLLIANPPYGQRGTSITEDRDRAVADLPADPDNGGRRVRVHGGGHADRSVLRVSTERVMVLCYNGTVLQGTRAAPRRVVRRERLSPLDVIAQYTWMCASRFRRTTPPECRNYNADGNIW